MEDYHCMEAAHRNEVETPAGGEGRLEVIILHARYPRPGLSDLAYDFRSVFYRPLRYLPRHDWLLHTSERRPLASLRQQNVCTTGTSKQAGRWGDELDGGVILRWQNSKPPARPFPHPPPAGRRKWVSFQQVWFLP